jgi:hypothetical protein
MSKLKIPAAFLVIGAMLLGVPAILPRSLLCPQLPSRWRRRVSWSKCDGTAAGAGGTAGAAGMVDPIAAIPFVVGAART